MVYHLFQTRKKLLHGVPPSYILFGRTVPPRYVLFGITVPLNIFLLFFGNLGKYKVNFTQGQIWWTRIGQRNLSLLITFYSSVQTYNSLLFDCILSFNFISCLEGQNNSFPKFTNEIWYLLCEIWYLCIFCVVEN